MSSALLDLRRVICLASRCQLAGNIALERAVSQWHTRLDGETHCCKSCVLGSRCCQNGRGWALQAVRVLCVLSVPVHGVWAASHIDAQGLGSTTAGGWGEVAVCQCGVLVRQLDHPADGFHNTALFRRVSVALPVAGGTSLAGTPVPSWSVAVACSANPTMGFVEQYCCDRGTACSLFHSRVQPVASAVCHTVVTVEGSTVRCLSSTIEAYAVLKHCRTVCLKGSQ